MQLLWARILASEIRKPKSFSLKTLRFVAELDQSIAQMFEKYLPRANGSAIPVRPNLSGDELIDLLNLQDADLVSGVGSLIQITITLDKSGLAPLHNQGRVILLRGDPDAEVSHQAVMLTKTGLEIARVISLPFDMAAVRTFVEWLPKNSLNSISLGTFIPQDKGFAFATQDVLWAKDEPKTVAE